MSNIVKLGLVDKQHIDTETVICAALGCAFDRVVIVAVKDGEIECRSSDSAAETVLLLHRALARFAS